MEPEPKRKPSWWIAAAAFAAVIVVVGAALLVGNATSSEPPAMTPTTAETATTTTVQVGAADALTPAEEAFVAQFLEAFNGRDEAALLALASPAAKFTSYVTVDPVRAFAGDLDLRVDRRVWEQELAWRWALDEEWTAESCEVAFSAISCQVTIEGGAFRYVELQEAVLRIALTEDVATSVSLTEDPGVLNPETQELRAWLESEHPDQVDVLIAITDTLSQWRITDEAIAAWQELMPAYWAYREAGRP